MLPSILIYSIPALKLAIFPPTLFDPVRIKVLRLAKLVLVANVFILPPIVFAPWICINSILGAAIFWIVPPIKLLPSI